MTKEEILNLVELFNLETYNVNDKSFCIKGVIRFSAFYATHALTVCESRWVASCPCRTCR